jgi:hypothetical protein
MEPIVAQVTTATNPMFVKRRGGIKAVCLTKYASV